MMYREIPSCMLRLSSIISRCNVGEEVSSSLVDALIFALNSASTEVEISHVHISATTNGTNGQYSNHYKRRAMDISGINNQSIYSNQSSEEIKVFQESFDNYSDIRENFGPYFHHKLGENHNVGGHNDHIHVSTNNCQ